MSIGHSSSAYSLPDVKPSGSVTAASTMTACQPQNVNAASASGEQPDLAGALDDVVRRREQRAAAEREDHRVRVQRPQPAVGQPRDVEVELGPQQLGGDDHADQHAHDAPDDRHDGELAHHLVVERRRACRIHRLRLPICHRVRRSPAAPAAAGLSALPGQVPTIEQNAAMSSARCSDSGAGLIEVNAPAGPTPSSLPRRTGIASLVSSSARIRCAGPVEVVELPAAAPTTRRPRRSAAPARPTRESAAAGFPSRQPAHGGRPARRRGPRHDRRCRRSRIRATRSALPTTTSERRPTCRAPRRAA